jgi:hypothetical protein
MSQENVKVVRRLIEAWNRDEQERVVPLERVVPFLDPGVIFDATRRIVNPKTELSPHLVPFGEHGPNALYPGVAG